jgi:hypothetical protein
MKQTIVRDRHRLEAWNTVQTSRCYVHLCEADDWRRLTGAPPPQVPPTARDYTNAGLPWFDFDAVKPAVEGASALSDIKSVGVLVDEKTGLKLTDNDGCCPANILKVSSKSKTCVREY